MLAERGVNVDHTNIYCWVQRYVPEIEKRLRWNWRNPTDLSSWHIDETYVKVNGHLPSRFNRDKARPYVGALSVLITRGICHFFTLFKIFQENNRLIWYYV